MVPIITLDFWHPCFLLIVCLFHLILIYTKVATMNYGKVPVDQLSMIDFTLAEEPLSNSLHLKGKKYKNPAVYIGCAKWASKEWRGKIFPVKTSEKNYLDHYVNQFNTVELNVTRYKTYRPEIFNKWADKAKGKDFKFCPKLTQSISNYSSLVFVDDKINQFLNGVVTLGKHLGPVFIELSNRFSPARKENLYHFLENLPRDISFFLEVRHHSWFVEEAVSKELGSVLSRLKIGFLITDKAGRRDAVHMHLTVPRAFIRFAGNNLHPTDYVRINDWVTRIKYWLDNGLKELYFIIHMPNESLSPELTLHFIEKLNAACGLEISSPVFLL